MSTKDKISIEPLPADPKSQFEWLCNYAKRKISWYWTNIGKKRSLSKAIRYLSIFLLAFAGLFPVVQTITYEEYLWGTIAVDKLPNWGYIFLAIAGALNLLDRQTGMSSGYLRYVSTTMELERLYHEFVYKWHCILEKDADVEDPDLKKELSALVGEYKKKIDEEEKNETEAWITEFQTAQTELNALIKSKTNEFKKLAEEGKKEFQDQQAKDSKIIVLFKNYENFESAVLKVTKDGTLVKNINLKSMQEQKVIAGLMKGSHEVEIEAKPIDPEKRPYKNQVIVNFNAEHVGEVKFDLK